jgi:DNA-binding response OmpR family regulator
MTTNKRPEPTGRVLVVDDDDAHRPMLCQVLQRAGFDVLEAATQLELQRRLALSQPDALLISLQRSATDGLGLLMRLRARQTLAAMPIAFLVSSEDDDFRRQALCAGADWLGVRPHCVLRLRAELGVLIRNGRLTDHDVGQFAGHHDNALDGSRGQIRLNPRQLEHTVAHPRLIAGDVRV